MILRLDQKRGFDSLTVRITTDKPECMVVSAVVLWCDSSEIRMHVSYDRWGCRFFYNKFHPQYSTLFRPISHGIKRISNAWVVFAGSIFSNFKSGRTVFCHSFSNEFPFEVVCFLLYKIPRKEIQSTWAVCAFSLVQHSRHPVPSAWLLQRGSQVNWMCLQLLATVDKNHFLYGVFLPVRMLLSSN